MKPLSPKALKITSAVFHQPFAWPGVATEITWSTVKIPDLKMCLWKDPETEFVFIRMNAKNKEIFAPASGIRQCEIDMKDVE